MEKASKICWHARVCAFILMGLEIAGVAASLIGLDMGSVSMIFVWYFVAAVFGALDGIIEGAETAAKDQEKAYIQRKALLDELRWHTERNGEPEHKAELAGFDVKKWIDE